MLQCPSSGYNGVLSPRCWTTSSSNRPVLLITQPWHRWVGGAVFISLRFCICSWWSSFWSACVREMYLKCKWTNPNFTHLTARSGTRPKCKYKFIVELEVRYTQNFVTISCINATWITANTVPITTAESRPWGASTTRHQLKVADTLAGHALMHPCSNRNAYLHTHTGVMFG